MAAMFFTLLQVAYTFKTVLARGVLHTPAALHCVVLFFVMLPKQIIQMKANN